jgi:membrane-bound lytic murein transglycosylase D
MEARMRAKIEFKRMLAIGGMTAVAALYIVPRAGSESNPVNVAMANIVPVVVTDTMKPGMTPNIAGGWDLPNLDNPRVDSWVERFTKGNMKSTLAIWFDRKDKYDDMISEKLAERGMPQDLVYLAMIESGFNPKAKSPAAAGGLWQFISETGRRYGLKVNGRIDERNQPDKATDAALSYLSDLHDRFGSWYLAAAAYNTGENRVGRIMREVTGSERGTDADYYAIANRLPKETRDYVPKMIAAARIAKEPARYGFDG